MSNSKPNIVYVHSHDTGRYIQPYGFAIPTPNLQKLAEQGVLFRKAFCAAPTCSPSRAALLTGQSAHSSGMLGLAHRGFKLNDYKQYLVHTLKKAGYYSALFGIQHLARTVPVENLGYDEFSENSAEAEKQAVDFIQRKPKSPFFLDVGFFETHRHGKKSSSLDGGFNPKVEGDPRYVQPPSPLPDHPKTRADMADYIVSAQRLDQKIGKILEALEAHGLMENTLIISTTDHGLAFPGMKCSLSDHGIGVSLIMKGVAPFQGGQVCDAMISHIDIFPTLCDLIGISKPEWLQGRSLLPVLQGKTSEVNEEIFAEVTYHAAYEPKRAIRTQKWKYIRNFNSGSKPVMPNCDTSPSKDLWMENGWLKQITPHEELYHLLFDPQEQRNLANHPEYKVVLEEMRERLDRWMKKTNDPLLKGDVPLPEGTSTTHPSAISPGGELPEHRISYLQTQPIP